MTNDQIALNRRSILTRGSVIAAGVVAMTGYGAASGINRAAAAGLTYNPIDPYRAYDSREDPENKVAKDKSLYRIPVTTDMFDKVKITSAKAITFTLTIAGSLSDGGFLSILPGDVTAEPKISTINWDRRGAITATGSTVKLGGTAETNRHVNVFCGGGGQTPYLIDVTGYYN